MLYQDIKLATAFMDIEVEPPSFLLEPILPTAGLAMLYAPRGVGKTNFSLSVALAVATGKSVFGWKAGEPRSVLYIDGEMPVALLQQRLRLLTQTLDIATVPDNLYLLSSELAGQHPDLSCIVNQEDLSYIIEHFELIILDNLSSLTKGGENDSADWQSMQEWLIRLRAAGIAVLMVHHAGKSGQQRGTSRREDVLDTVVALRRPLDYSPAQGSRFEVHIEKARQSWGEVVMPFEVQLISENEGEVVRWVKRPISQSQMPGEGGFADKRGQFLQRLAQGAEVERLAAELGIGRATAYRWAKREREREGELSL